MGQKPPLCPQDLYLPMPSETKHEYRCSKWENDSKFKGIIFLLLLNPVVLIHYVVVHVTEEVHTGHMPSMFNSSIPAVNSIQFSSKLTKDIHIQMNKRCGW